MAQSEPNPNNNPTVTGQEAWFNEDARFYKDLYVYGNLYYDFEGTDAFNLDNLNVSGIATFNDVDITGSLDVEDLIFKLLICIFVIIYFYMPIRKAVFVKVSHMMSYFG